MIFYGLSGTPPGTAPEKKRSGKKRSALSQAPLEYQMNGSSPFGAVFVVQLSRLNIKQKQFGRQLRGHWKNVGVRRDCANFERQSTGLMFAY